jgi:hypothetical protein
VCGPDQVVNDMKRMKEEHIDLVERMQGAYREIEEESKVKGNLKILLIFFPSKQYLHY